MEGVGSEGVDMNGNIAGGWGLRKKLFLSGRQFEEKMSPIQTRCNINILLLHPPVATTLLMLLKVTVDYCPILAEIKARVC